VLVAWVIGDWGMGKGEGEGEGHTCVCCSCGVVRCGVVFCEDPRSVVGVQDQDRVHGEE